MHMENAVVEQEMTLSLPSYAKINWTLEILGKRADGYHELRTLLQTIDVGDLLHFERIGQGIEIRCNHPEVPCDERNLAHRAAAVFFSRPGAPGGIRITIEKRLPVAAGIGGGSSNAAVTLLALDRLCGTSLPPADLFSMGASIGADVPCFFIGGTVLGVGRGDEVYPAPEISCGNMLLVNAGIAVPTRDVYGNLPPELTNPGPIIKMPFSLAAAYAASMRPDELPELHNDLEPTVFARHPLLAEIRHRLAGLGAKSTLMSGSGSTIFAIFDSEATRSNAIDDCENQGWWCAPTRTIGREEYRRQLGWSHATCKDPEDLSQR
jgi:4-diphosphocytidyl-2-C-methyl-D-erythritol kinase